jgi:predicted metal-dependent TIM-barrel fold hydrolase
VHSRQETILLTPLAAMDAVLEQEFRKGEVAGLKLALALVGIQIDALAEDIETALKEQEDAKAKTDGKD